MQKRFIIFMLVLFGFTLFLVATQANASGTSNISKMSYKQAQLYTQKKLVIAMTSFKEEDIAEYLKALSDMEDYSKEHLGKYNDGITLAATNPPKDGKHTYKELKEMGPEKSSELIDEYLDKAISSGTKEDIDLFLHTKELYLKITSDFVEAISKFLAKNKEYSRIKVSESEPVSLPIPQEDVEKKLPFFLK